MISNFWQNKACRICQLWQWDLVPVFKNLRLWTYSTVVPSLPELSFFNSLSYVHHACLSALRLIPELLLLPACHVLKAPSFLLGSLEGSKLVQTFVVCCCCWEQWTLVFMVWGSIFEVGLNVCMTDWKNLNGFWACLIVAGLKCSKKM